MSIYHLCVLNKNCSQINTYGKTCEVDYNIYQNRCLPEYIYTQNNKQHTFQTSYYSRHITL